MNIVWHGNSCFRITENVRGEEVSVIIDPYAPEDGKRLPRSLAADIALVSHDHARHNNLEAVGGEPFIIDGPGEYEVKEVSVRGVATFHDDAEGKEKGVNTMFYLVIGGVHIVHLGDLRHGLTPKHLEDFHEIDILMLPVGGGGTLGAKEAAEIANQLQPRIIIPMHYRAGGLCGECDEVASFLKAMGSGVVEAQPKLKISAKDLPQEDTKIIILDPQ